MKKLTSKSALDIVMDLLLKNAISGSDGSSADSKTTALFHEKRYVNSEKKINILRLDKNPYL